MNRDYINDHNVIDRYLFDQLSEEEQVEFELYFLEHPEVLDEVDMARSLQRGLKENQDLLDNTATTKPAAKKSPLLEMLGGWFQSPVVLAGNFAIIATLLVLVIVPGQKPPPTAFSADRAWIGQVRGEDKPLKIDIQSGNLVLDVDVNSAGPFAVSLLNAGGRRVRHVEQVVPTSDALLVVFTTDGVGSGRYTFRVTDPQGKTEIERELRLVVSK